LGVGVTLVDVPAAGAGEAATAVDDGSPAGVEADDFDLLLPVRITLRIDEVRRLRMDFDSVGSDIVAKEGNERGRLPRSRRRRTKVDGWN